MAARKKASGARRPARRGGGRRSGSSGSAAPLLALGLILGLGAFSLWATAEHKSPQAALTSLFGRSVPKHSTASSGSTGSARPAEKPAPAVAERRTAPDERAVAGLPVPRPSVPVAPAIPVIARPAREAMTPQRPLEQVVASAPSGPLHVLPPRGVNNPAHSPSVVYAATRLTIRKNAWDRAPAVGVVEKGVEMRSYGKTGRWHRVTVPRTTMMGWVREEEIVGGREKPDSARLVTGSITPDRSAAQTPFRMSSVPPYLMPPRAVGARN